MDTQKTSVVGGFFTQLMPMLAERTLMVIVSKIDDQHLTLSVVPKRIKDGENTALTTPLCCTGTVEELDRDLPAHLREFVAGQLALSNNLAQIQREREQAEKAAREELKKKQKTVGNGGVKGKAPEIKPKDEEKTASAAAQPSMMSLFESTTEAAAQPTAEPASDRENKAGETANTTTTIGGER